MISSRTLNDDEQWLVDCCRLGQKADFSQRPNNTDVQPEIAAELICQLILGYIDTDGIQSPIPLPLGLRVRGARIRGRLQLAYIRGSNGNDTCVPLVFEHCDFVADASGLAPDQAIDLHQESKCAISSADSIGPLLWRIFRALYAIGGAYMTSMLILSISGVMRRSTER